MTSPRDFTSGDRLGICALASVGFLAALVAMSGREPGYSWLPILCGIAGGIGTIVVIMGCRMEARSGRLGAGVRGVWGLLTEVWRDPPRDWIYFVMGVLVSLPLLALHTRVLQGDADSARLIASTYYVERNGIGYLIDTQENLVPHIILGPLLRLGGIPLAKLYCVLSLQMLAGVLSFITWKVTRNALGAFVAPVSLLAIRSIPDRSAYLPMYPTMLALGTLGVYYAYRATVLEGSPRRRAALASGLCLVGSMEAHAIGQVFLGVTLFILILSVRRRALVGLAAVYGATALFFVPRAVINLWEGGLGNFTSYRLDYWITKGYLVEIQENFWGLPIKLQLGPYVRHLVGAWKPILGWEGLLVLALGVVAFVLTTGRGRWFGLACASFFLALVLYRRLPFYPRYFAPLVVGTALCAGIFVALLARRGAVAARAAAVLTVAVSLAAVTNFARMEHSVESHQRAIIRGPYAELAARIDDGNGVVGARAGYLQFASADVKTYGGQFLTEDEFATYLTWPTDRAVLAVLERHDIGWILLIPSKGLEKNYHDTWLVPHYGRPARQITMVPRSSKLCLDTTLDGYRLYRVGSCEGDGAAAVDMVDAS